MFDGAQQDGEWRLSSTLGVEMQLPNDLAADDPEVVDVASDSLPGEASFTELLDERAERRHEALAEVYVGVASRPALRPWGHLGAESVGVNPLPLSLSGR